MSRVCGQRSLFADAFSVAHVRLSLSAFRVRLGRFSVPFLRNARFVRTRIMQPFETLVGAIVVRTSASPGSVSSSRFACLTFEYRGKFSRTHAPGRGCCGLPADPTEIRVPGEISCARAGDRALSVADAVPNPIRSLDDPECPPFLCLFARGIENGVAADYVLDDCKHWAGSFSFVFIFSSLQMHAEGNSCQFLCEGTWDGFTNGSAL